MPLQVRERCLRRFSDVSQHDILYFGKCHDCHDGFSFVGVLQHEPCALMRSPFVREHTSAAVKRALRYLTNGRGAQTGGTEADLI